MPQFIDRIATLAGKTIWNSQQDDVAMRVIADHARATTFLVADGVLPSNEGRGYVLRRIMSRAIRFGRIYGVVDPFLVDICPRWPVKLWSDVYPHLARALNLLDKVVRNEESRFGETLDHGLALLSEEIVRLSRW